MPRTILAGLVAIALCATAAPEQRPRAELILVGGDVWTGNTAQPRAQAIAIAQGRIAAVGDDASIKALAGPATRTIELRGRSVLPGLVDAHVHLLMLAEAFHQIDLSGSRSAADAAARMRARLAKDAQGDAWIRGRGWTEELWQPRALPTRQALDEVTAGRPAWLLRSDGHAGSANTEALKRGGVDASTPDPPGGRIVRDAEGAPTGVLIDTAMGLVTRAIPRHTDAELDELLSSVSRYAASLGLTGVHDLGATDEVIASYQRLAAAGRLPLRVTAYRWLTEKSAAALEAPPPKPVGNFALRGIKLFADGTVGAGSAWLLEPYAEGNDHHGGPITPPAMIEAVTRRALAHGWLVATHALGDRAVRTTLDAYERALDGARDRRLRIEHAVLVDPADRPRFARLGVVASVQPVADVLAPRIGFARRLGGKRAAAAAPWRDLLSAGAPLLASSDAPIDQLDPLRGLAKLTSRLDGAADPSQRLGAEEALAAYTKGPAWAAFEERERGQIAEGFRADLTVLDGHFEAGVLHRAAAMTLVEGRIAAGND
jgi:predicted amidohydrolase YtcJ